MREPIQTNGCDHVCFTDDDTLSSCGWQIRRVESVSKDPVRNAKIHKILPHRYLPQYEYSVWVDGTHLPAVDVTRLIDRFLADAPIAFFAHPCRTCAYHEARVCIRLGTGGTRTIKKQVRRYRKEGYPEGNGLVAGGVILRRHHDPLVVETMEQWWAEIVRHSARDQISFNYAARKTGLIYTVIPGDIYDNPYFAYAPHLE